MKYPSLFCLNDSFLMDLKIKNDPKIYNSISLRLLWQILDLILNEFIFHDLSWWSSMSEHKLVLYHICSWKRILKMFCRSPWLVHSLKILFFQRIAIIFFKSHKLYACILCNKMTKSGERRKVCHSLFKNLGQELSYSIKIWECYFR